MKSASLAIVVSSSVLAVTAPEVQAAGGHRGALAVRPGPSGSGGTAPRVHHSHPHTRVFIGGNFFFWPRPYYYPAPYSYYYAPDEAPVAPLIEDPYWYYCEEAGTYFPYVKECPGGWQQVLPPAAPLG